MLIEKGELTSGSTWHAAGQCPSFIGDYTMAMINHHSNTLYPKLEELTGQYTSWHGCGGIRLVRWTPFSGPKWGVAKVEPAELNTSWS